MIRAIPISSNQLTDSPFTSSSPMVTITSSRLVDKGNGSGSGWIYLVVALGVSILVVGGIVLFCNFSKQRQTTGTQPRQQIQQVKQVRQPQQLPRQVQPSANCPSRQQQQQQQQPVKVQAQDVPKLTDETFAAKLDNPTGEDAVIMVYGAWCGWSKKSLPAFSEAAAISPIPFYLLEDKDVPKMTAKYKIQGFPTYLKFSKGKSTDYKGDRSVESLVDFASK